MTFILAIPETDPVWPASSATLQAAYPNTLFGPDLADLEDFYLYPVAPSTPPEFDPTTQKLVEIEPTGSGDTWTQQWSVVSLSPQELEILNPPQWVQFGAALAADAAVNALVASLQTSAPVLHLMLGVGLGQAAQGSPQTFLAAWASAYPSLPEGLAADVAALAATFNLPASFIAAINPS